MKLVTFDRGRVGRLELEDETVIELDVPSTREWFSTARNYALYSNQGGTYDDILKYLKL